MTISATEMVGIGERHTVSVTRLLVTGAVTAAAIFVLCWIGTLIPYSSPTHAYIGLFTNADVSSGRALVEGAVWSLLFGGLSAALFAVTYNAAARVARR
jgi:hypothetical protein